MNQSIVYQVVATTLQITQCENTILDPLNPIFRPFTSPNSAEYPIVFVLKLNQRYKLHQINIQSQNIINLHLEVGDSEDDDFSKVKNYMKSAQKTHLKNNESIQLLGSGKFIKVKLFNQNLQNIIINKIVLIGQPVNYEAIFNINDHQNQIDKILIDIGLYNIEDDDIELMDAEIQILIKKLQIKKQIFIENDDFGEQIILISDSIKKLKEIGKKLTQNKQLLSIGIKQENYELCQEIKSKNDDLIKQKNEIQDQFLQELQHDQEQDNLADKINKSLAYQLNGSFVDTAQEKNFDADIFGEFFENSLFSQNKHHQIVAAKTLINTLQNNELSDEQIKVCWKCCEFLCQSEQECYEYGLLLLKALIDKDDQQTQKFQDIIKILLSNIYSIKEQHQQLTYNYLIDKQYIDIIDEKIKQDFIFDQKWDQATYIALLKLSFISNIKDKEEHYDAEEYYDIFENYSDMKNLDVQNLLNKLGYVHQEEEEENQQQNYSTQNQQQNNQSQQQKQNNNTQNQLQNNSKQEIDLNQNKSNNQNQQISSNTSPLKKSAKNKQNTSIQKNSDQKKSNSKDKLQTQTQSKEGKQELPKKEENKKKDDGCIIF